MTNAGHTVQVAKASTDDCLFLRRTVTIRHTR